MWCRVGVSRLLGPNRLSCLSWDVAAGRLAAGSAEGAGAVWRVDTMLDALEVSSKEVYDRVKTPLAARLHVSL